MIQCSQATADLLIEKGKGSWLTTREDLVNAKGKGILQTYFVNPKSSHRTESVASSEDDGRSSGS